MIGVLAAAAALAALIIRPFSGLIADRYDRNRIILLTQFGTAIVLVLYIIAPGIEVLIALRLAQGLLFGLGSTAIATVAIKTIPEDIIGRGVGILTITGISGQAIAPIIGISIVEKWSFTVLFIFTCIIALAAALFVFATRAGKSAPKAKGSGRARITLKDLFAVEATGLLVLTFIIGMAIALPANYIVLFAHTRDIPHIGLFFTVNTIAVIVMRIFGSGLVDKYSYRQILPFCAALSATSLAIIGASYSFPPICIAAILLGVGFGLSSPTLLANMIRVVRPERVGTASATYYFGFDLAFAVGPIAMGLIAESTSYSTGFFIFIIPTLIAIPLTLLFSRKQV